MTNSGGETEVDLRRRLGVPADAQIVLVFGETSHWDPNWLLTSEQYYRFRVKHILDSVVRTLEEDPRRVFSIECLFFLKLYWDREPGQRESIRRLVNERRMRLTGTGITTPDTVLPGTEAILRDFLQGQQWLHERGMTQEPRLAYFPDDFGHSPMLPAILGALGLEQVGITRIDGMYFVGSDLRRKKSFPLPGSSAELLLEKLRTLDFIWQTPDGAEVLGHWNAYTYFQGDMLAHLGVIRWMGLSFGLPWRTEAHVARRIAGFVNQLRPLARTPYLFCPIGCDFNGPIEGLLELLDRYNQTRYPDTGVWVVNAGMDDYLDLVSFHRSKLPTLELDPNPYWMGFYASRPDLKLRCNRIAHKLQLAEAATATSALSNRATRDSRQERELREAWDLLVVSNHHDYITGTSPDRVWHGEQLPWLIQAEELADRALGRISGPPGAPRRGARTQKSADLPATPSSEPVAWPRWSRVGQRLEVETGHYRIAMDEAAGGCIVELEVRGEQVLAGPANDLLSYRDSGGLWRMGHEFLGGVFEERVRASHQPARIEVEEQDNGQLLVQVLSELEGRPFVRWLWLGGETPMIRMRVQGAASRRRTVTCSFPTRLEPRKLTMTMDVPGGLVDRPVSKLYDPTFWPARSFAHLRQGRDDGCGVAVIFGGLGCVTCTKEGSLQWVVLRNAPMERAFGVLPLPAHPASGADPDVHQVDYGIVITPGGDHLANQLARRAQQLLDESWLSGTNAALAGRSALGIDRDDVLITSIKRASRGPGLVVRLLSLAPGPVLARLTLNGEVQADVREARLCDALERDRSVLELIDGSVLVPVSGSLVSVRLVF